MDYNARYYSPRLGRFVSPDSVVPEPGGSQGWNRYMYVKGNPINRTDPTGHFDCEGVDPCPTPLAEDRVTTYGIAFDFSVSAQTEIMIPTYQENLFQHFKNHIICQSTANTCGSAIRTDGIQASDGFMIFYNAESMQVGFAPYYSRGTNVSTHYGVAAGWEGKLFVARNAMRASSLAGPSMINTYQGSIDKVSRNSLIVDFVQARDSDDPSQPFIDQISKKPVDLTFVGEGIGKNIIANGVDLQHAVSYPADNYTWVFAWPPDSLIEARDNWWYGR